MSVDELESPGAIDVHEVGAEFVALNWAKSYGGWWIKGYYVEKRDVSGPQVGPMSATANKWQRCNLLPLPACAFNVLKVAGLSKPSTARCKVRVNDPRAATLAELVVALKTMQVALIMLMSIICDLRFICIYKVCNICIMNNKLLGYSFIYILLFVVTIDLRVKLFQ